MLFTITFTGYFRCITLSCNKNNTWYFLQYTSLQRFATKSFAYSHMNVKMNWNNFRRLTSWIKAQVVSIALETLGYVSIFLIFLFGIENSNSVIIFVFSCLLYIWINSIFLRDASERKRKTKFCYENSWQHVSYSSNELKCHLIFPLSYEIDTC